MTMRITPETKAMLESIKKMHKFESLDEAVVYAIENPNVIRSKFYSIVRDIVGTECVFDDCVKYSESDKTYRAIIHTMKYQFLIMMRRNGGYLSCKRRSSNRLNNDNWTSDTSDVMGTVSPSTISRIKSYIISGELVKLNSQFNDI